MRSQLTAARCPNRPIGRRRAGLWALLAALGIAPVTLAQAPGAQAKALRAAPPPPAQALPIEVPVGGRATVTLAGLTRLRILDPALADVRVEAGGVVRLRGLSRGQTELVFWRNGREERRALLVR